MSNLRKIKNAILDYYQEVLELDLVQFPMPDCGEIGEHAEEEHLGNKSTLYYHLNFHFKFIKGYFLRKDYLKFESWTIQF